MGKGRLRVSAVELGCMGMSHAYGRPADKNEISLAWMLCKKPWIVPIPGTRRLCRLKENIGAADICFTADEVAAIDQTLQGMEMSEVFGGSKIISGENRQNNNKQIQ